MEYGELFEDICRSAELGAQTGPIERVPGGLTHKMYHLRTETGEYAVKILNPEIMKRPDALGNFARAEALEAKLEARAFPIVPALPARGEKMRRAHDRYYYIFPWVNGESLKDEEITREHAAIAGGLLGRIHGLEPARPAPARDEIHIDWDFYALEAKRRKWEIAPALAHSRAMLYDFVSRANRAFAVLPAEVSICDGDMDPKNVLWKGMSPLVIDLECLSYANPWTELANLSLEWSGIARERLDYARLCAFIQAYLCERGLSGAEISWDAAYAADTGALEWLAYNLERALGRAANDEDERALGAAQAEKTLRRLIYIRQAEPELLACLYGLRV